MPQRITLGYRALIEQAEREIETLSLDEAIGLQDDPNVVLVDIRDIRELQRDVCGDRVRVG